MKYAFRFLAVFLLLVQGPVAMSADLPDFTDLAASSGRAVVNISTVKIVKKQQNMQRLLPQNPHGKIHSGIFF